MRKAASILVMVPLLSLSSISCSKQQPSTPPPTPPSAVQIPRGETGPFVVIGHLQHQDRVVTIKSGAEGLVYSVHNRDGKILFDNLTAAQLRTESPDLHDFIETGTAGHAGLEAPQLMQIMVR